MVALYAAILARDPDRESRCGAVVKLRQGAIENLLDGCYIGMFDRQADSAGVRAYMGSVRSGRYTDARLRMIRSVKFERRLPG